MKSLTAREKAENIIADLTAEEKRIISLLEKYVFSNTGILHDCKGDLIYTDTDQDKIKERFKCDIGGFFEQLNLIYDPLFSVYFKVINPKTGSELILRSDNIYESCCIYFDEDYNICPKDSWQADLASSIIYYLD